MKITLPSHICCLNLLRKLFQGTRALCRSEVITTNVVHGQISGFVALFSPISLPTHGAIITSLISARQAAVLSYDLEKGGDEGYNIQETDISHAQNANNQRRETTCKNLY